MLPPCLSLEESFRKGERKKEREKTRMFYAELGLSCEVHVRVPNLLQFGGEHSALCQGSWTSGEPQERRGQCGVRWRYEQGEELNPSLDMGVKGGVCVCVCVPTIIC